jgi:hypothetical protein
VKVFDARALLPAASCSTTVRRTRSLCLRRSVLKSLRLSLSTSFSAFVPLVAIRREASLRLPLLVRRSTTLPLAGSPAAGSPNT